MGQIPGVATATADVRLTDARAGDALVAALKESVDKHRLVPDTHTEISIDYMRPIFEAGEKGKQLAVLAKSIYVELGNGDLAEESTRPMPAEAATARNLLLIPGTTGGTDAGFAATSGHPAVLESLGLAGWGYHAKNEYIEVDSIVPRIYLTVRMIQELSEKSARP
jgi:glutamate carboxypeptidase